VGNAGNGPVFVYQWSPSTNTLKLKTTVGQEGQADTMATPAVPGAPYSWL
jgi:hypothetical protein